MIIWSAPPLAGSEVVVPVGLIVRSFGGGSVLVIVDDWKPTTMLERWCNAGFGFMKPWDPHGSVRNNSVKIRWSITVLFGREKVDGLFLIVPEENSNAFMFLLVVWSFETNEKNHEKKES
jgi:hypothetical protein